MKNKYLNLSDDIKQIYTTIATKTIEGANIKDFDLLHSILASAIVFRHGKEGLDFIRQMFGKEAKGLVLVGQNMSRYVAPQAGYILRHYSDDGFYLAYDYLRSALDISEDCPMPKDLFEGINKDYQPYYLSKGMLQGVK